MASSTMSPATTSGTTPTPGTETNDSGTALEKVQEARRTISSQVSTRMQEQADQRSTQAGEQVSTVASALRDTATNLRFEGKETPAKALESVTEHVEHLGSYLTRVDGNQLIHDLEDAARKRPWAVAAAMFGVGVAASRVLGASSRDRYESRGGVSSRPTNTGMAALRPYDATLRPTSTSGLPSTGNVDSGTGFGHGSGTNGNG